ncbi:MAG: inorganic phosphate transporter [Rhizobiales bacterium]|nr:inorganic phosphate transporter [Hyphomicrobiales bacterium]
MSENDNQSDDPGVELRKETLDKDLTKLAEVNAAVLSSARPVFAVGIGILFLALAGIFASITVGPQPNFVFIIVAAMLGGYMALNIGANDVANNVGPAVGSRALTLMGALVIAAVFESAGALIAGGDVVATISKGIIDPSLVPDSQIFVWAMMAALLAAAVWVNLATYVGAPVSTTHSVVGGVMGAGIAAVGFEAVNWVTMGKIAASWVISPFLGGLIAALFLAFIKINIIYQDDKIAAARRWLPILIAIMASVFTCYLAVKGLKRVWQPDWVTVLMIGIGVFVGAVVLLRPWVRKMSEGLDNRNESLRILFRLPLICSAALLSFAHGANDVANAVGPLAAILHSVQSGEIATRVVIPIWVMVIGAVGISLGLFLFGPRMIRLVGAEITRMNPMRAFCVALSAAITVIFASALGLPVSSTHIAVGAIFGVGFFREYYTTHSTRRRDYVLSRKQNKGTDSSASPAPVARKDARVRKLVRRAHFITIIAAWFITVPATAIMAAAVFWALSAVL